EGHPDAHAVQPLADTRDRLRRLVAVDRDAHQLRASTRQRRHLLRRRFDVSGVGVRHRLNDARMLPADEYAADIDRHGLAPRAHQISHGCSWSKLPREPYLMQASRGEQGPVTT